MKTNRPTSSILLWCIASFLIFSSCVSFGDQDAPPQNEDPPKQLISIDQAKFMYDAYSERRERPIIAYEQSVDSTTEFNPTRYGEYDLETVKQYIAYIESEAKMANATIGKLRFYFTNYPNAKEFPGGGAVRFPRQNSFVLLPTTEIDGKQQGFVTRTTADGGREVVAIRELVKGRGQGSQQQQQVPGGSAEANKVSAFVNPRFLFINPVLSTSFQEGDVNSTMLNESHIIPPPKQDTDFDD